MSTAPSAAPADAPAAGSYGALWAVPQARSLAIAGTLGRLPTAINALGLLLLLRDRHGIGQAALAVSVFTFALAAAGPLLGRVADTVAPRAVLVPTGIVHPLALVATVAVSRAQSTALVLVVVALAGATAPPVTACARAAWPRVTGDEQVLATAYATDAVMTEVVWILGPLLVGLLQATAGPRSVLLTSAGLALVGTLGLARHPACAGRPEHHGVPVPRGGVLALPSMRPLLWAEVTVTTGIGLVLVGIPAYAPDGSTPGILIAVWGVGSGTAGVLAGRLARRATTGLMIGLTAALAGLTLLLAAAASGPVLLLGAALVLVGFPLAPFNTVVFQLVSAATPARLTTSAFAWLNTTSTIGVSLGAALAGVLLPGGDGRAGAGSLALLFAVAAGITLLGAAGGLVTPRRTPSSAGPAADPQGG